MVKMRIAKKDFTDSFGNPIKAGEPFGVVEVRPLFVSRKALQDGIDEFDKPVPHASDKTGQ